MKKCQEATEPDPMAKAQKQGEGWDTARVTPSQDTANLLKWDLAEDMEEETTEAEDLDEDFFADNSAHLPHYPKNPSLRTKMPKKKQNTYSNNSVH